jgi:cellobiose-specific phosphotransferase system component IIA
MFLDIIPSQSAEILNIYGNAQRKENIDVIKKIKNTKMDKSNPSIEGAVEIFSETHRREVVSL